MRAPIRVAGIVLAVTSLFGCSAAQDSNPPPCPRISVLSDAAKLVQFRPGPGRDATDVELQADLANFKGSCTYNMDERIMNVTLTVGIEAQRGPAAQGREAEISYFVAMPAFFPKPEAKQLMKVPLAFPENVSRIRYADEEVTVTFPISDFKQLSRYEVVLGLQLTQDQLDYNRKNKRPM